MSGRGLDVADVAVPTDSDFPGARAHATGESQVVDAAAPEAMADSDEIGGDGVDGDELSDGMDISGPTYHQHLRAAQQKVFDP